MQLARQGKISLEEDSATTNVCFLGLNLIIVLCSLLDINRLSHRSRDLCPQPKKEEGGHEALAIDEKGFDPKAFKLFIKAGYDPKEKLNLGRLPPEVIGKKLHGLNATQIMLKEKGHAIQESRVGLGFTPPKPIRITTKRVNIQSDDEDDKESVASSNYISNSVKENIVQTYHITLIEDGEVEEEDAEDAPAELEEGIKATIDELKEVNLGDIENPRPIYISASLTHGEEGTYVALLHEFKDVFAWSYKEMPGLDQKVAVHHLSVKKGARPIKQGQRRFRPELIPLIEGEVNKLIEVGFIREVKYPMWISSIVPVRKKNGQIRVCVDFRDLNNACPKDDFPLPIAKLMIDATTGHEALSFMDGSSGYNQIRMAPADKELTAFRTPKGIYCYKVMPFGLKNTGATYQRAMQKIFDDMLHKNVECYVDDLVVKSKKRENHFHDLRKVFERLRRYQLKMNPSKCAFGVTSGKFLGFIVRQRGIEIEQAKIDAILRMPEPRNIHELKSLQGKLAYLRRTPLILYIVAQERSVGILLAQKNDEGKENVLYYLSRTMTPNELKYSPIEKLCLALIFSIQKLKHYFQSHSIHLVSKANPLKYVMAKPVLSDRLARWYLQLQQFEITYVPQKAVKGQVLADFLADHPMPAEWELSDDLLDEDVLVIEVTLLGKCTLMEPPIKKEQALELYLLHQKEKYYLTPLH
ncbi:UNVERIFIED_CONTAM: Transposon Tf2-12 polyprotein [Sesamum angustifolium]|uniref:Transposon Tf2-12 polyprotein n=1 Tax=Sesamum angustifolium TaxID=2727405 RepID=A0AAW2KLU1_9LAMI